MAIVSINPSSGQTLKAFEAWDQTEIDAALQQVAAAAPAWADAGFAARAVSFNNAAAELRANQAQYAALMTLEMGKPIKEARVEVEKCALGCEYFATHAQALLADEAIATDATLSYVSYPPIGTVLAIMPWNFPFWQVFRFAAPALMAGNTAVLKHASNVPQCALAIEDIFRKAGFPEGVLRTFMIGGEQAEALIGDPRIQAVTLTGSGAAGRRVAAAAGAHLKKSVLELGGSDAFLVLADADLERAAEVGVAARFLNGGQSCIAAKRFIVVESVAARFLELFKPKVQALNQGDPKQESTQVGPLARADLRFQLAKQVRDSVAKGALPLIGCENQSGPGFFYKPSILDWVKPGQRAYEEELFGPVAIIIRAQDDEDALRIANDSAYGLGASIWTRDAAKGERLARRVQSGQAFVNGMVKSDPRLPFGGIKASGYGRELAAPGIREFVNVKTIWIK